MKEEQETLISHSTIQPPIRNPEPKVEKRNSPAKQVETSSSLSNPRSSRTYISSARVKEASQSEGLAIVVHSNPTAQRGRKTFLSHAMQEADQEVLAGMQLTISGALSRATSKGVPK